MSLPPEITARRDGRSSRLGDIIRRLSSSSDGEVVATVHALRRMLESHGADLHALADHIERVDGLSDADREKIRATVERARLEGYAEGVKAAESKHHGTGEFRNTDGKLEWSEVALFLQRNKHRLDARHHQFVDDMASRTAWGREPSPRQHQYLTSRRLARAARLRDHAGGRRS